MQRNIDKLLRTLEKRADELNIDIDNHADYQRVCQIVTALDFHDPVTYEDKLFVRNALRDILFPLVRLNYHAVYIHLFGTAPL